MNTLIHLRAVDVSLVLDMTDGNLPAICHWGQDLGPLTREECADLVASGAVTTYPESPSEATRLSLVPSHCAGWAGRPGISGSRGGRDWSPDFTVSMVTVDGRTAGDYIETGPACVKVSAVDEVARLELTLTIELHHSALIRSQACLTNVSDERYQLDDLTIVYPVPEEARELLDMAGRWGKERTPQRRELVVGTHLREGRRGHTGAEAATVVHAGTPGFGFRRGRIWAVHVGWSGNHTHFAERLMSGEQVLGGGELLLPGEVVLQPQQSYTSPWVYASYGVGLDGVAQRFHRFLRARDDYVSSARPVTLNVWEAVYFDHDVDRLVDLADSAASIGVERFVLDDGWFGARRDASAGLGDWVVSPEVWPRGLHALVNHVRALDMKFGLWFEPEMVNLDSDVARAHPEWIMQTGGRLPIEIRGQQVLNLAIPDCYAHIRDQMLAILAEYEIDYIKWDHNRDLIDAGNALDGGRSGTHDQTLAFYRLVDDIKSAYPNLEIESCSAGGSRIDLGVLARTDRVWASDCNDPLERQQIQHWTSQLVPPELIGSHVASERSHTTSRAHDLSFRAATAVLFQMGIEWDLSRATAEELAELKQWILYHKKIRELAHHGDIVRVDFPDDTVYVSGVVARDKSRAVFAFASVARSEVALVGRIPLPGLDARRRYRVRPETVSLRQRIPTPPRWWGTPSTDGDYPGAVLTGAMLESGIRLPALDPEHALLIMVDAITREAPPA